MAWQDLLAMFNSITGRTMHWQFLLPLLLGFIMLLMLAMKNAIRERKTSLKIMANNWLTMKQGSQLPKPKMIARGVDKVFVPTVVVIVIVGLTIGYIHAEYPVATYMDVTVHPKNENGDWRMDGREDFGEHRYRRGIMFRPCEPKLIEPILQQAAAEGWVAHDVSWQQRPNCQSVFDPQFGFNFNDEQGHYRSVTNARPTAQ